MLFKLTNLYLKYLCHLFKKNYLGMRFSYSITPTKFNVNMVLICSSQPLQNNISSNWESMAVTVDNNSILKTLLKDNIKNTLLKKKLHRYRDSLLIAFKMVNRDTNSRCNSYKILVMVNLAIKNSNRQFNKNLHSLILQK